MFFVSFGVLQVIERKLWFLCGIAKKRENKYIQIYRLEHISTQDARVNSKRKEK
jgi:hypothetical protein